MTTKTTDEPIIVVNGRTLAPSQAMTMRVAVETFAMTLTEDGKPARDSIEHHYLARIGEIRKVMGYG